MPQVNLDRAIQPLESELRFVYYKANSKEFDYTYSEASDEARRLLKTALTEADKHGYQRGVRDCSPDIQPQRSEPPDCIFCGRPPHPDSYGHSYRPREQPPTTDAPTTNLPIEGCDCEDCEDFRRTTIYPTKLGRDWNRLATEQPPATELMPEERCPMCNRINEKLIPIKLNQPPATEPLTQEVIEVDEASGKVVNVHTEPNPHAQPPATEQGQQQYAPCDHGCGAAIPITDDKQEQLISEALDNAITALGQVQKGTARQFLRSAINAAIAAAYRKGLNDQR